MDELIPITAIAVTGLLLFPLVVSYAVRRVRRGAPPVAPPRDEAIARLEAELQQTRAELLQLKERQQFVEALLEKRSEPSALPR